MSLFSRLQARLAATTTPRPPEPADEIRLYSASWCHHCKRVTPTFRKLRRQYPDHLKLIDLSDRSSRRWASDHIRVVPTLVALNRGEVVARQHGPFTAGGLSRFIADHLREP